SSNFTSLVISLSTEILLLKITLRITPAINVIGKTIAITIINKRGRLKMLFPDLEVATRRELLMLWNKPFIILLIVPPVFENSLLVAILYPCLQVGFEDIWKLKVYRRGIGN